MSHRDAEATFDLPAATPFHRRHVGPGPDDVEEMLAVLGQSSMDAFIDTALPAAIRDPRPLALPEGLSESEVLATLRRMADRNQVWRSYIGCGYHGTHTPPVVQRNILEDPGWYTQYTPYQAEISQGRLELLLVFQTLVSDLTGLPVANASLLDEGTAAAEAMAMFHRLRPRRSAANRFFVAADCHPQTLAVLQTRAAPLGIEVLVGDADAFAPDAEVFGCLLQYPATDGRVLDHSAFVERAHEVGCMVAVAADLLALTVLREPGAWGADAVVGSTQRFGVPMGYGGPHAAYMATRDKNKRQMPGRIIGVSRDSRGRRALRMSLQTREQHIRRAKATSNICTAQVLLANIAAAYACYHGPDGLKSMARRIRRQALALRDGLTAAGHRVATDPIFDTVRVWPVEPERDAVLRAAAARRINLRQLDDGSLCISLDETVDPEDVADLLACFGGGDVTALLRGVDELLPAALERSTAYLEHPTFHRYRSETEMMRWLGRLRSRDLSLCQSMIPLGSCTMKLNAAAEMIAVTWPEFGAMHPFAPREQAAGYVELFERLESQLCEITGFDAFSLQPNAGSQGEYAGLLAIQAWHVARGHADRRVCLIPTSAHGTNPASAVMAGMDVVAVNCDDNGNIDIANLRERASKHADRLGALMVTYPSTHGVFEEGIREICDIVHEHGGQVYFDGANLNALVGFSRPADLGADVCHLNLHKTFAIPHGGGGPGVGPIGVRAHLAPYLPGHPAVDGGEGVQGPVAAAPWGSASVLPISWAYIALNGSTGLRRATEVAILNANYIAARLVDHFPVLYRGPGGLVAHECILDVRGLRKIAGVTVDDVAKRLMDYGFHAPTMSWPVAGTLMVEPTESESRRELDRFCEAMEGICAEARRIAAGEWPADDNPLHNAPHTADMVAADHWPHAYPRSLAGWPNAHSREYKFWPHVGRVDNAWGDRNLISVCPPDESDEGND